MLYFLYNWGGINKTLFIYVNQLTNIYLLPKILHLFSQIFFIGNFAFIYIILCINFYIKIKNSNNKQFDFQHIYNKLVRIGIIYSFFGLTFSLLKFSINMPRPFCSLNAYDFITIADITRERCLSSFPSAHTGLALLVTYFLYPYLNNILKIIMLTVVLIVAISRITLAMHFPADIIYSLIVTFGVISIGNLIYLKLQNNIIKSIGNSIFQLIFSGKKI